MSAGGTPVWVPSGDGCKRTPLRRYMPPPCLSLPVPLAVLGPVAPIACALSVAHAGRRAAVCCVGIPARKIRDSVAEDELLVGSEGLVVCLREDTGEQMVVPKDILSHREELPPGGAVDDLTQLAFLNEASILDNLHQRYEQKGEEHAQRPRIYTYCGRILIAVNPFQPVRVHASCTQFPCVHFACVQGSAPPADAQRAGASRYDSMSLKPVSRARPYQMPELYTPDMMQRYRRAARFEENPPHLFGACPVPCLAVLLLAGHGLMKRRHLCVAVGSHRSGGVLCDDASPRRGLFGSVNSDQRRERRGKNRVGEADYGLLSHSQCVSRCTCHRPYASRHRLGSH